MRIDIDSQIEARALELWRAREMELAPRVRRMQPDAIDKATGAWASCIYKAMVERESDLFHIAEKQDSGRNET